MQHDSNPLKRRRRYSQFGIRLLLCAITLLALILAMHTYRRYSANQQIAACAEIKKLGGMTQYSYSHDESWNAGKKAFPEWLEARLGRDYLYTIDSFVLASKPDASQAIEVAATLPGLRLVKLPGCRISDESIKPLAKLKRLEWLELFYTPVTDECMETVARIRSLKTLDLRHTKVTDNSIEKILSLPQLTNLYIGKSAISEEGVTKLRAGMPNCNVDTER